MGLWPQTVAYLVTSGFGKLIGDLGKLIGDLGKLMGDLGKLMGDLGKLMGDLGKLMGDQAWPSFGRDLRYATGLKNR